MKKRFVALTVFNTQAGFLYLSPWSDNWGPLQQLRVRGALSGENSYSYNSFDNHEMPFVPGNHNIEIEYKLDHTGTSSYTKCTIDGVVLGEGLWPRFDCGGDFSDVWVLRVSERHDTTSPPVVVT